MPRATHLACTRYPRCGGSVGSTLDASLGAFREGLGEIGEAKGRPPRMSSAGSDQTGESCPQRKRPRTVTSCAEMSSAGDRIGLRAVTCESGAFRISTLQPISADADVGVPYGDTATYLISPRWTSRVAVVQPNCSMEVGRSLSLDCNLFDQPPAKNVSTGGDAI